MIVGVDFDNTIVSYDHVFHLAAVERGLIPEHVPATKQAVRQYLRECGREEAWTELQGYVYGPRMAAADAYPGAIDFMRWCVTKSLPVFIISHKTRHPYIGPPYDLHASAYDWLRANGFFDPRTVGLRPEQAVFELTKEAKLARIAQAGCTIFVDDLPEFLLEPAFLSRAQRFLFDPNRIHAADQRYRIFNSWESIRYAVEAAIPAALNGTSEIRHTVHTAALPSDSR